MRCAVWVMSNNHMIRYIVFRDEDTWIAQGLEVDISAQADSAEKAMQRFGVTIRCEGKEARSEGRDLFDIGPAPKYFFQLWNQGEVVREQLEVA